MEVFNPIKLNYKNKCNTGFGGDFKNPRKSIFIRYAL
jgi:hypothetical protein